MFDIALKATITLMITILINKFLSAFRIRQLYASIDQVLDCHDINIDGYTATITAFNRGKDKEKGIQIIIPGTTYCQIIAHSLPGALSEENIIRIDRLAPGETMTINVFIRGNKKLTKKNLPIIKSEDITGRLFWGRENVWPSLGPLVFSLSLFVSVMALFGYIMWKTGGPDQAYFTIRYHNLYNQGFAPKFSSDNYIISKTSILDDNYPFKVQDTYIKNNKVHFPIKITNTSKSPQSVEIRIDGIDREYYLLANKLAGDRFSEAALMERYSVPNDFWRSLKDSIDPQETKVLVFTREITPNLKLKNLSFEITIKGTNDVGEPFLDSYVYQVPSLRDAPRELKLSE
ncbi:hypothetical protein VA602_08980 [Pseudomonas sp. MH2]|uniref:Uncharacterized protein n=1 Tax=Pseudomonas machongensis TaxID=3110229 RepID=A0ABU5VHF8_9PSED|nr:hypothetical protein [Pseudomonas sp. MH2]MEA5671475.1 hypothetical protein [Pseudomonas sp. MH2]